MNNVEYLVKSALASTLNMKNINDIGGEQNLRRDLKLDSMSSLMFLMKLEETIDGFFVDPETLTNSDLNTVSSVISYVDNQLASEHVVVH